MRETTIGIAWLEIADPPELWAGLGFTVDADGACVIGGVEHRLVGVSPDGPGIVGWALRGHPDPPQGDVDGLRTRWAPSHVTRPAPTHANGVTRIDHLVVRTPDTPRTTAALETLGLRRRGHRDTNSAGEQVDMTFFWVGDVILELAGPPRPPSDPERADQTARFAGIAYASADLDATVRRLGHRATTPRAAVQPGRRIAALRPAAGSTMPMAFMSPHPGRRDAANV